MNLLHRLRAVHQVVALQYICLQRFRQPALHVGHQTGNDLPHRLAVQPGVFHPLGGVVVRFQTAHHLRSDLTHRCQLGVHEVIRMIEARRLAEQQIRHAGLELEVLDTFEPYEFNLRLPVREHGRHPLRLAYTHSVVLKDLALDLHKRVFVLYLVDIVEPRAVDVLVRILLKQLGSSLYAQLLTQNVSPTRADILAVCDIFV